MISQILSILVCSTHTRSKTFLPVMMDRLFSMRDKLSDADKNAVEILFLVDTKSIMLGDKRNFMVDMAQGEYIVFVDDDDRLEDDYISVLLQAIRKENADVITFQVSVSLEGAEPKICKYSKYYEHDYNTDEGYFRIPNHICCVKKSLAHQVEFPSVIYGEDAGYGKKLKPLLKTETYIPKVLYHYDFNSQTTETQQHLKKRNRIMRRNNEPVNGVEILRFDIINKLIAKNHYQSYLEIGTRDSDAASKINCAFKVGVDPAPVKRINNDFVLFFNKTSDQFFQKNPDKFDLIFIDGLHTYEQSRRDLINAMNSLNENGSIVMHDCLPHNKEYASLLWNGEVFKTVNDIHNAGLNYYIVDSDHGCLVIKKQSINEIAKQDSTELTYEQYVENKREWKIISSNNFMYGGW